MTLKCCGIEKAKVGGYLGRKLMMVLYDNGTLVQYDPAYPVSYALYIEKCGCNYKIVCGYSAEDGSCKKYYEVCYDMGKGCHEKEYREDCHVPANDCYSPGQPCHVPANDCVQPGNHQIYVPKVCPPAEKYCPYFSQTKYCR